MALFGKKNKKTPEELKKEREEKIAATTRKIDIGLHELEKKKEYLTQQILQARRKGLKEPEQQARNLMRQTLAAIGRQNSMKMTLELAVVSRDLAQLNADFMTSIGALSEDILDAGRATNAANTKKVEDKFLRAVYESNQQKERIDEMLAIGEYSSAVGDENDRYVQYDEEIDQMIEAAESSTMFTNGTQQRNRYQY